jgi:hypothetical protein
VGALHVLLDSLIDRSEDIQSAQHCLIDHYASAEDAANRLGIIAGRAMRAAEVLPRGVQHATILAAMVSFYLSAPGPTSPVTMLAAKTVLERIGPVATPTMAVHRARRTAGRLLAGADARAVRLSA